jgi:Cu-Zn family superoxide dismutase
MYTASAVLVLSAPAFAAAEPVRADGPLVRYSSEVDEEATARVHAVSTASGQTVVTLHVQGFAPDQEYGAHAHVAGCGTAPADPLGHLQHVQGTATDPAFANPDNEIWLDFTTDELGNGSARAKVPWVFTDRRAESVVIHAEHTHTGPSDSGVAGPRLACLDVDF